MPWLSALRTLHTRSRGVYEGACSSRSPSSMRVFARADVRRSARISARRRFVGRRFLRTRRKFSVLRSRAVSHGLADSATHLSPPVHPAEEERGPSPALEHVGRAPLDRCVRPSAARPEAPRPTALAVGGAGTARRF